LASQSLRWAMGVMGVSAMGNSFVKPVLYSKAIG